MYKWQQVKALKAKGTSIKNIVRQLKISRNTVRKYLRSPNPPCFKVPHHEKMLDGYKDQVEEMLERQYIGTRIHEELTEMGFGGSLSTVHRHIREIKKEAVIREKVTTRFETPPGRQIQYDWKEWQLPVAGRAVKIYLHEVVLGYSRKKHYSWSLSITASDIIRAIEAAILFFEGVASELLIDNPKQMVLVHDRNGVVRYTDEFLTFCGLYGIEPSPCQPYRARTKGKAERPFYYVQEHLLRGLEVTDFAEFDVKLREFTDRYNERIHSSLGESPEVRYGREKEYLKSIPLVDPALLYRRQPHKVSSDGYLSYGGGFYPVSMSLCLREVMVEPVFGRQLRLYDARGSLISEMNVDPFTKVKPLHPEHEVINEGFKQRKDARRAEIVIRFVTTFEQTGEQYLEGLKERVGPNLYWHLSEIMKYAELYGVYEVVHVLKECVTIGTYHKNSVKRLLSVRKPQHPPIVPLVPVCAMPPVVLRRELSEYRVEVCHA